MSDWVVYYGRTDNKGKWPYLLLGFKEWGIDAKESQALSKEGDKAHFKRKDVYAVLMEFVSKSSDKRVRVWYDMGAARQPRYKPQIMKDGDLYFTIQYEKDFKKYKNVYQINQVAYKSDIYIPLLSKLRAVKDKMQYKYDVVGLFKATSAIKQQMRLRYRAVELSLKQSWKNLVSFIPGKRSVKKEMNPHGKLPFKEYWLAQSQSKICLSMQGAGYHCFRDTEVLGIGACLLVVKSDKFPRIGNSENCYIEVKEDLSDLVDVVNYYLKHNEEREKIASNGRDYFDRYLTPKATVGHLLKEVSGGKS